MCFVMIDDTSIAVQFFSKLFMTKSLLLLDSNIKAPMRVQPMKKPAEIIKEAYQKQMEEVR